MSAVSNYDDELQTYGNPADKFARFPPRLYGQAAESAEQWAARDQERDANAMLARMQMEKASAEETQQLLERTPVYNPVPTADARTILTTLLFSESTSRRIKVLRQFLQADLKREKHVSRLVALAPNSVWTHVQPSAWCGACCWSAEERSNTTTTQYWVYMDRLPDDRPTSWVISESLMKWLCDARGVARNRVTSNHLMFVDVATDVPALMGTGAYHLDVSIEVMVDDAHVAPWRWRAVTRGFAKTLLVI